MRFPPLPLTALRGFVASWPARAALLSAAALLAACSTPAPVRQAQPPAEPPKPVVVEAPPEPPRPPSPAVSAPLRTASATSPRDYRRYGATHIYENNAGRIYKGMMPPLLYAVGVLNVDIDGMGQVQRLEWMRAPRHAPEVMAEIERMVRAAAPFPAPTRMGRVTWTDVWLWDRSGQFQLDTLTEGQLGRAAAPAPARTQPRSRTAPPASR